MSILEQSGHPRLVAFSLEALAHSELRPHVLRILANRCEPEFLNEWLCQGWRLAEPRLARTMAAVKELACVEDRAAALLQLPAEAERHLGRWIRLTGLPSETRSFVIKELYRRGGSDLRRSALWALIESCDERSLSLLRVIASERDTDSSRMARIELARRFPNQYAPRDLLPEASVTTSAPTPQAAEPPLTLERYWNEFDQLDEPERLRLGSLILARTPRAWAVLNRQLSNPETTSRVRAVKMVTTLGLSASFSDQLYTLSFDHEPEVRSAAVLALGKVPNPTSKRILQQALGDPDDRVQANAVEAGEEGGQLGVDALLPKLASTDNRVRANAVKALLKLGVREAAETLVRMLRDPDRRQRASALWLVEKLGLFALTGRIVLMADGDQDPNLRRRAASIRDRLLNPSAQPAEVGP